MESSSKWHLLRAHLKKAAIILALGVLLSCQVAQTLAFAAEARTVAQATMAAASWLRLVDGRKYRVSYEQASALLKDHITEQNFARKVEATRKPLGAVISRKLALARYATSLPGEPDGQYVVIRYSTSFANKKSATETVTPVMDKDGHWRVAGYYIR